jgi:hypothetical protein
MRNSLIIYLATATGLVIAAFVGVFGKYLISRLNMHMPRRSEQLDLYNTIKADLANLRRHCRATHYNISAKKDRPEIRMYRKAKYSDAGLLSFDIKKAHLLHINLCMDIFHIFLFLRNNELELNLIIELIETEQFTDDLRESLRTNLLWRLTRTEEICDEIIMRLEKHASNPIRYDEEPIDQNPNFVKKFTAP